MKVNNKLIIAAIFVLFLVAIPTVASADTTEDYADALTISFLGRSELPRGVRNNNPGNLKISGSNNWKGKVPADQNTDGVFEQFFVYVDGVRAMIVLLRNYINSGSNTITAIINRYAPPGTAEANPTQRYIETVSTDSGIAPLQSLTADRDTLKRLVLAMSAFENGREAINDAMFSAAILRV